MNLRGRVRLLERAFGDGAGGDDVRRAWQEVCALALRFLDACYPRAAAAVRRELDAAPEDLAGGRQAIWPSFMRALEPAPFLEARIALSAHLERFADGELDTAEEED